MSQAEPFSFGRKIKELKKLQKKGYADLTAELKISRERIIALEEGEREPTQIELQRFAEFYGLPVEELQPRAVATVAPPAAPRPNFTPNMQSGPRPAMPPNGNQRPPMSNNRPSNAPVQSGPRPSAPSAPRRVEEPRDKDAVADVSPNAPKLVMKYTAEQLGDIESAYLRKQRDLKVPLTFTFLNGKEYTGIVTDFTPFTIHIVEKEGSEEVILRKLAIAYYRKADGDGKSDKGGE